MATRNIYLKLSKSLEGKESILKTILISIWIGGFILIAILSRLLGIPEVVNIGGRIWFSICILVGVLYITVTNFNTEKDQVDKTAKEVSTVIFLNLAVAMAIFVWFIEE